MLFLACEESSFYQGCLSGCSCEAVELGAQWPSCGHQAASMETRPQARMGKSRYQKPWFGFPPYKAKLQIPKWPAYAQNNHTNNS